MKGCFKFVQSGVRLECQGGAGGRKDGAMSKKTTKGNIIPGFRYRDAPAAIAWLKEAFGFEEHLVVVAEDDSIAHAQLTLGSGMIMLGSATDDDYGKLVGPPTSRPLTGAPYIVIEAIDAHYERAKAAGAEMINDIHDEPYGGRHYACRDPQGQVWNFGSYDPWVADP